MRAKSMILMIACDIVAILLAASLAGQTPPFDLDALKTEAEARLKEDMEYWGKLEFRRQVTRRFIGKDGEVTEQLDYDLWVRPTAKGFDEELRRIDGREPSAKEIKEHRKKGRHAKQYEAYSAQKLDNPAGEDIPLSRFIHGPPHRLVGEETIRGELCYRLEFDAQPEPQKGKVTDRLVAAMEGTVWLTVEGAHLAKADIHVVRSVAQGPAGVNKMRMRMELAPVDGHWLPTKIEVVSDLKAPFMAIRRHNTYLYSEYRRP